MFFQGNEKYNCATYLRLSRSDGDQQESNSIKNQRALLNDYMGKHPELHKFDEYVDDGYSGTNFERPDFKRMMQDIEKRNVNCIIVKDLSRFGRNYIETGRYLERIFPFMGVRFIAINDHYDSCKVAILDHHLLRNLPILPNWCRPFSSHPLMSIWIQEHSTTQFMDFSVKMTSKRPNAASHDVNYRMRDMVFLDMFATSL